MRSHSPRQPASPGPAAAAGPSPSRAARPRGGAQGNAALAEQLAASGQGQVGPDLAMGRGHAAGMLAGFGIAAANALGSGGLPAMLNPNAYWDTMPEQNVPSLVRPAGAMIRKAD